MLLERECKDRGQTQFVVVDTGVGRVLLLRQQPERLRGCDQPRHAFSKHSKRGAAEFALYRVVSPHFFQCGFPPQPQSKIRPAGKLRPQGGPALRPVAAGAIFRELRNHRTDGVDLFRDGGRHQQGAAEGRSGKKLRPGQQYQVTAFKIGGDPFSG